LGVDYDFLKVLDFGMVKGDVGRESVELTAAGTVTGTPAFVAPDIAAGGEVDGRADLYSLGCVAYWLLTGVTVFEADNPTQMVLKHMQEQPSPPSALSEEDIPAALDSIVLRCLEKAPSERPATALELANALGAVELREPWTYDRACEWWKRHMPQVGRSQRMKHE
jgi:serine/threonine-protein kinase